MSVNRREFLQAGFGLGSAYVAGVACLPPEQTSRYVQPERQFEPTATIPEKSPSLNDYIKAAEGLITNPVYRAASISIMSSTDRKEARSLGHGGLFTDDQERPYFMTAWHVVDDGNSGAFNFLIPGVGYYHVRDVTWRGIQGKNLDNDPCVAFYPEKGFLTVVTEAIRKDALAPLRQFVPYGMSLFKGITVMADKGAVSVLSFAGYDSNRNRLQFTIDQGRICTGFSGQPVLFVENGMATNKSCGLIAEAEVVGNASCTYTKLYVRPHI